jgi:hypothetical protein
MTQKLDYFDLTEHNTIQKVIFWIMVVSFTFLTFYILLPLTENFFEHYLKGIVYNSGESLPYRSDIKTQLQTTSPYTYWAVDIYIDTPQESRNWVNPALALFFPSLLPGLILTFILSTWLPRNFGLVKQKIEREIISELDQLTLDVYGVHTQEQRKKIQNQIINADLRNIHDYVKEWDIDADELMLLRKAIIWQNSSGISSIFKSFSALSFFLKFYITKKYTSLILGTVYFGAAVLLLVIGLRGVKFIPASEPSLLFFALGLEFCLLIIYAVTMMYGKEVPESKSDKDSRKFEKIALSKDFGSDKEAENLLKVFILKDK